MKHRGGEARLCHSLAAGRLARLAGLVVWLVLASTLTALGEAPGQTSEPGALETDVVFTRRGGIAGFDDRFELSRDGAVRQKKRFPSPGSLDRELGEEALGEIAERLHDCGLFDQDRRYTSRGADMMIYSIQYNGVTVTASDGELPPELIPVISWFNEELDRKE